MASRGWGSFVRDAGEAAVMETVAIKKPGLAAGIMIAKTVMGFLIGFMFLALFIVIIAHSDPVKNTEGGQKIVKATARVKARMFKKNGAEDQ